MAWAQHRLAGEQIVCVTVRDGEELIGIAPLYLWRYTPKRVGGAALRMFGTGSGDGLTEVVALLAIPERTDDVVRAVLKAVEEVPGWDWLQLSLGPTQGWLVPQWVTDSDTRLILHHNTRASVVRRLATSDRESLLSDLKRNVRESVRRGHNRIKRLGGVTFEVCEDPVAVAEGTRALVRLHRMRAAMDGVIAHDDLVGSQLDFLLAATSGLAAHDQAQVHLARHNGVVVAGQLVLSDGGTDYLSITGLDPAYWALSLNTLLIFEAMAYAAKQGRKAVNLSTGPDISKLRWSNEIVTHHDFTIVRGSLRARLAYGLYAHVAMSRRHRDERRRHRRRSLDRWATVARGTTAQYAEPDAVSPCHHQRPDRRPELCDRPDQS